MSETYCSECGRVFMNVPVGPGKIFCPVCVDKFQSQRILEFYRKGAKPSEIAAYLKLPLAVVKKAVLGQAGSYAYVEQRRRQRLPVRARGV
jgi:hypothetical protein